MYNTTNITGSLNPYDIAIGINQLSSYLLGTFFMFSIFVILFIALKKTEGDTPEVLLAASFITSVLGVILLVTNFITWTTMIYPIILMIAMIIYKIFSGGRYG